MPLVQPLLNAIHRAHVRQRAALLLIVLFAFALRVFHLGAPAIWWDESLSLYRATRDMATILANTIQIQNVLTTDLQPPLYFLFLHFLVRAIGTSEFALRVLTVFASTASVPLLYALGKRVLDARTGLIAAALAALSPFYVTYAQEARPYAFVLFWSLLAVYALVRAFQPTTDRQPTMAHSKMSLRGAAIFAATKQSPPTADRRPLILNLEFRIWNLVFVLSAIAALYSHYYAIFIFPLYAILITLSLWNTPRSSFWILLPAIPFASIIFLVPLIQRGAAGNVLSGPASLPLHVMLFDLLNSFSVGVSVDAGQMLFFDFALLAIFALGIATMPRRTALILGAFLFAPIVALQLATLYRPLYQNSRYFIAISPGFYLGVAAGMVALARRWRYPAAPALAIFVLGAAISLNNLYFVPRYGKDDHRAWAEYLRERVRPGDFLILNSPHAEELFNYYARGVVLYTTLPILRADGKPWSDAENRTAIRTALRQNARVWYLSMHFPFDDPEGRIERFMDEEGVRLDQARFAATSTELQLSQFITTMPAVRNPRDIPRSTDLLFGPALRLVGYDAPEELESGAKGIVKLFWQLDQPVGEDFGVSLRVMDNQQVVWGQWDALPIGNLAGTSVWPPRTIFAESHDLPIYIGTRPGNYQLLVTVYRASTGRVVSAAKLTDVRVTRPRAPIDPSALRATARLDQSLSAVRAIGADWTASALNPGDALPVSIYFQVLQKPRADIPITMQLAQRAFPIIGPLSIRAESHAMMASNVEIGDIVREDFSVRIPADASGELNLRAVVDGSVIDIGALRVKEIARTMSVPGIARPMSARVGDSIEFLGYDLQPTRPRGGDPLRLVLYWRANKTMETSFTVFTHVVDGNNQILGQQDSIPAQGARPTTGWTPGEVIVDVYQIHLNAATPPGKYQIEIGWYNAATGARLPVFDARGADAGDRILLPGFETE